MQLAKFDPTGETGDDSDGDGIPFLPQQPDTLAPVWASEATLDLTTYQQQVNIQSGWSIISSWVDPFNPALETLFGENAASVTIMLSRAGIYWPSQNINLIGNWNVYDGYKIKTNETTGIGFTGAKAGTNSVVLPAGFSYLPVLSETPVDNSVLEELGDALIYAYGLQDGTVYWPEGGIATLTALEPGKGYGVFMNYEATLVFPEETLKSAPEQQTMASVNHTPWNNVTRTGDIQIFSIRREALSGFETGDVIGAFNGSGLNVGMTEINDGTQNLLLLAYGDDITSENIDGLTEDEQISFKLYRPADRTVSDLEVTYDKTRNDGKFVPNSASVITGLKSGTLGINKIDAASVKIFPNPSNGVISIFISGDYNPTRVDITDSRGQTVFSGPLNNDGTMTIDLTQLRKGVYFARIGFEEGISVRKILIQ